MQKKTHQQTVVGGWWFVDGGSWLVVGGWWLVVGGWWFVVGGSWSGVRGFSAYIVVAVASIQVRTGVEVIKDIFQLFIAKD